MKYLGLMLCVCMFASSSFAAEGMNLVSKPLEVGDKAPSVQVAKWLNGKLMDPSKPDGKTIYVVEFWATWCAPCKVTIPEMNKLNDELAAKGVHIMGITKEKEGVVSAFMKQNEMKYSVGLDKDAATNATYMSGVRGIPHAFVIDKKGFIVWKGHPMNGMVDVVKAVAAGTYDANKAKKVAALQQQLQQARDPKVALDAANQLIVLEPQKAINYKIKISIFSQTGGESQVPAVLDAWAKSAGDNIDSLAELAAACLGQRRVDMRNPELAIKTVQKAYKITGGKDASVAVMLAQIYSTLGLTDKAVAALEKSVKLVDEKEKAMLQAHVDYYKKLLKLKATVK